MHSLFVASYVLLWITVVVLAIVGIALARQIGLIYETIPRLGARMGAEGLELGETVPDRSYRSVTGGLIRFADGEAGLTLVMSASLGCTVCTRLLPAVRALARNQTELQVVLVVIGADDRAAREYSMSHRVSRVPITTAREAYRDIEVSSAPYALVVDRSSGTVLAKGLPNGLDQLEGLLEFARSHSNNELEAREGESERTTTEIAPSSQRG